MANTEAPTISTHRSLENVEIRRYGANLETWAADHGMLDEKGRKVGGTVTIQPQSISQFAVRIQATRDGVTFGACRRSETCTSIEHAHEVATRKLVAQRKAFARKYPAVQP